MPIHSEIKDRIAEIVFDVPPVNAFDSETWNGLPAIIREAGNNPEVNVVLIRAAEEARGFCGGVDIKEMQAHPERITLLNRGNYLTFKAVRDCEVPVVVAVHKFVIGGGIGICGASDTIIAADDAFFSLPEVDRGAMEHKRQAIVGNYAVVGKRQRDGFGRFGRRWHGADRCVQRVAQF